MLGLQQGNAVLKEIHKEMNPESVERLMEETAEAQAYQREVDEMLATQMTAEEEDAVQSELEQLEREAGIRIDEPQKETTVKLPSAPQTEPVSQVPVEAEPQKAKPQAALAEERQAVLA